VTGFPDYFVAPNFFFMPKGRIVVKDKDYLILDK
jgi:hypothetical protein